MWRGSLKNCRPARSSSGRAQPRLPDQTRYSIQYRTVYDLLHAVRQVPAPVRVRVGGAGEVRLLDLGEDVLELHQHQTSARAGEIGENGVPEFGRIDRFARLG